MFKWIRITTNGIRSNVGRQKDNKGPADNFGWYVSRHVSNKNVDLMYVEFKAPDSRLNLELEQATSNKIRQSISSVKKKIIFEPSINTKCVF